MICRKQPSMTLNDLEVILVYMLPNPMFSKIADGYLRRLRVQSIHTGINQQCR